MDTTHDLDNARATRAAGPKPRGIDPAENDIGRKVIYRTAPNYEPEEGVITGTDVTSLVPRAEDDCAQAFIARRIGARELRRQLSALGFRDWEIDARVDVLTDIRGDDALLGIFNALWITAAIALVIAFAFCLRGVH